MKKLFFLFAITVCMTSCRTKNAESKKTVMMINGESIHIYVIDSCEYIGYIGGAGGDWATHKGNCKFCEARKNKNNKQ